MPREMRPSEAWIDTEPEQLALDPDRFAAKSGIAVSSRRISDTSESWQERLQGGQKFQPPSPAPVPVRMRSEPGVGKQPEGPSRLAGSNLLPPPVHQCDGCPKKADRR
jgi:hypothetical protein